MPDYPTTPDGRYFVVRGRLWRKSNPDLSEVEKGRLVKELMNARNDVRLAKNDVAARKVARGRVNEAKIALGERGSVWWHDGTPDYNRHLVRNSIYADWYDGLLKASESDDD